MKKRTEISLRSIDREIARLQLRTRKLKKDLRVEEIKLGSLQDIKRVLKEESF